MRAVVGEELKEPYLIKEPTEDHTPSEYTPALQISVGELVAFSCRSGDLIYTGGPGPTAQEGIRAHQKLQKRRPKGSEAEYRLHVQLECAGQDVVLEGRVDIFHPQADLHQPAQLDEIKTTYCHPDTLPEATRQLHWAQLKIYGFCYLQQLRQKGDSVAEVSLQMLWYNLKEKKSYPEQRLFTWRELESFAKDALTLYIEWHSDWKAHRQRVIQAAKNLSFPFPKYRPGQRQLAVSVYRCLRDAGQLVVEAPTGIGKTISTLFPAIKALGEGKVDQLLYLTAKNSGRQVVRETINKLHQGGLKLSLLELRARDKTCACKLGLCSRDEEGICPRTRGFYERLPQARQQLLGQPLITPEEIAKVADQWHLCPFELSLQMLPWADLVVCDFNYVFDPLVRISTLQDSRYKRALLVDEAHNLSERAREMHSASLSRKDSRRAALACKSSHPQLYRRIQSLVRALSQWSKRFQEQNLYKEMRSSQSVQAWCSPLDSEKDRPAAVSRAIQKVLDALSELSEQTKSPPEEIGDWLKNLYRYACIEQILSGQHQALTRVIDRDAPWEEHQLKLICLNAADFLRESFSQFHGSILFSATLRPIDFVSAQLGVEPETPYLVLPSPFEPSRQGVFLCSYLDTRYQARQSALPALVDLIARVYRSHPGNYLVFFPSYQFLQIVAERFKIDHPEIQLLQQTPGASDCEREAFLASFSEGAQRLGFAIMGGVFAEGVDFVGEKLIGTIIVGTGLPQINEVQELLRQSAEHPQAVSAIDGFDVAYRYPGMTRVLQTAGRVIRTESDRGVVVLADYRFGDRFYQKLYPEHWQIQTSKNGEQLSQQLGYFWNRQRLYDCIAE
ncbi:ATP-dependent DNA helicase [Microbulbifer sp. CnH-101-G]|uniref:ATP-dependent DNA helicase n=1 Tax=Microbulbifer sp. CnH-101-G TaxID=3243393 RepID=UPI00403A472B